MLAAPACCSDTSSSQEGGGRLTHSPTYAGTACKSAHQHRVVPWSTCDEHTATRQAERWDAQRHARRLDAPTPAPQLAPQQPAKVAAAYKKRSTCASHAGSHRLAQCSRPCAGREQCLSGGRSATQHLCSRPLPNQLQAAQAHRTLGRAASSGAPHVLRQLLAAGCSRVWAAPRGSQPLRARTTQLPGSSTLHSRRPCCHAALHLQLAHALQRAAAGLRRHARSAPRLSSLCAAAQVTRTHRAWYSARDRHLSCCCRGTRQVDRKSVV